MCGIAGLIFNTPTPLESGPVAALLASIDHRGPDDQGALRFYGGEISTGRTWEPGLTEVALFHRRLSILDLSEAGWQPMSTQDGRYHVVFNGEIYNFKELRGELESLGRTFHSSSDTEVLLQAYAEWGTLALKRFIGMFAFALLDVRARVVVLARDFFGIKPLYYVRDGRGLAFSSEIKTLLGLDWSDRRVHPERLFAYLRFGVSDHGDGTLFEDVRQLPPAHYLKLALDDGRVGEPTRYWSLPTARTTSDLSFDQAAARLRELFLESVGLHLRSDVPLGAALSGGIDSSSIVMAMRHLSGPQQPIMTFSFVPDVAAISEERWIDLVGTAAGATIRKTSPDARSIVSELERLIHVQDEPFSTTSIYAQYQVFRLAQEAGIKVMLDGQGADEMLGGYQYHLGARLASLFRQGQFMEAVDFVNQASRMPGASRAWLVARAADFLAPEGFQRFLRKLGGKELMPVWMNARWFADRGVAVRSPFAPHSREVLRDVLVSDLSEASLPHLLRYEDRNSMAHSIESRVPFLTPQLAEFLASMPEAYLIDRRGTTKALFRQSMRGLVPDAVLDRQDKVGFVTPERDWLAALTPWIDGVIASPEAASIPALDLRGLTEEWRRVRGESQATRFVWRSINLILWTKHTGARYV